MATDVTIRPENPNDHAAVRAVTDAAFLGMEYSEGDEGELVDALRRAGALSVSLVAELNGGVIGHIAFSPARASDGSGDWYALGPVSVLPEQQRRGVGTKLIDAGLQALIDLGARGCILVGHREYYPRFGFQIAPTFSPNPAFADHYMIRLFEGETPRGPIHFHPAFGADV